MKSNKKIGKILASLGGIGLLSSLTLPFLTSCTGSIEGMEPSQIINSLFPNVWVLIGVLISTIVLFIALIYLVWKPAENMISKRQEYMMNEIKDAEEAKKLADEKLADALKQSTSANVRANQIISDATTRAKNIMDDAQENANKEANIIKNKALATIRSEKIKAEYEIKAKGVDLAFELAQSLMNKNISKEDNQEFVDQFINSYKETK